MAMVILFAMCLFKNVTIKYLGVTFDIRLSWSKHVDAIFHEASQVRGFLQRNLRSCSRAVKLCYYKMYVDPILDYVFCSMVALFG